MSTQGGRPLPTFCPLGQQNFLLHGLRFETIVWGTASVSTLITAGYALLLVGCCPVGEGTQYLVKILLMRELPCKWSAT